MNKILVIVLGVLFLQNTQLSSQNLLHYAISTNGEKGECLFPEDASGNVFFSSIIDVPYPADSIMLVADDYIIAQNVSDKCIVERISNSSRTSTYNVQLNIGKQTWGMELWGSPLFVVKRDASHVKFKCIVEVRDGKYKYSLIDFETNRNTIRGEGKNDGQPNIIHWQRINSLTKEKNTYATSHDISKRNVKEVLFDYNSQIAYEVYLYQAEYEATKQFENGLRNLHFEDDFMDITDTPTQSEQVLTAKGQGQDFFYSLFGEGFFTQAVENAGKPQFKHADFNYSSYKGFLLDKGCNVYITSDDFSYEQAGAQELIKQTMIDGFWNVVDDINQAHFVMRYYVNLEGRDKAHIILMTPQEDVKVSIASDGTSESSKENHEVARNLYLRAVTPLYKKIIAKKYPKFLNDFSKE